MQIGWRRLGVGAGLGADPYLQQVAVGIADHRPSARPPRAAAASPRPATAPAPVSTRNPVRMAIEREIGQALVPALNDAAPPVIAGGRAQLEGLRSAAGRPAPSLRGIGFQLPAPTHTRAAADVPVVLSDTEAAVLTVGISTPRAMYLEARAGAAAANPPRSTTIRPARTFSERLLEPERAAVLGAGDRDARGQNEEGERQIEAADERSTLPPTVSMWRMRVWPTPSIASCIACQVAGRAAPRRTPAAEPRRRPAACRARLWRTRRAPGCA